MASPKATERGPWLLSKNLQSYPEGRGFNMLTSCLSRIFGFDKITTMKLKPARRLDGRLRLPGDKSISHRAALIAALATGVSHLSNFSTSRDCASTLGCLRQLGVEINYDGNSWIIKGNEGLVASPVPLDCGNSGSTIRMLAGILASRDFTSTLTGDESLRSRPMQRIIEPLEQMGAYIDSRDGKPPVTIRGSHHLRPIRYQLPVASAQVKSCILFAGLATNGRTEVIETTSSRDHTERLFNAFGVSVSTEIEKSGRSVVTLDGPAKFTAGKISIPGDISSAAYFIAAAMLLPGSQLAIEGLSLNPTRAEFLSVLRSWGADITTTDIQIECNEPVGTVRVNSGVHSPLRKDQNQRLADSMIPLLIDELPLLAVVGTQITGGLEIRNARELRVKETDRLAATVRNLRAMGADVEEYDDGLAVSGPTRLRGALIDSYGDHRIAMAFAVAALIAESASEISGEECVEISFPEFFQLLETVVER
jgi:3-phosphoshikimate 1-carboxyvinyltransferase